MAALQGQTVQCTCSTQMGLGDSETLVYVGDAVVTYVCSHVSDAVPDSDGVCLRSNRRTSRLPAKAAGRDICVGGSRVHLTLVGKYEVFYQRVLHSKHTFPTGSAMYVMFCFGPAATSNT